MTLRFFCGCFVIMMAVIQIAIYYSNLFDSRGSLTNFRGCFFVWKIEVFLTAVDFSAAVLV